MGRVEESHWICLKCSLIDLEKNPYKTQGGWGGGGGGEGNLASNASIFGRCTRARILVNLPLPLTSKMAAIVLKQNNTPALQVSRNVVHWGNARFM